jgi:hypothetical protein
VILLQRKVSYGSGRLSDREIFAVTYNSDYFVPRSGGSIEAYSATQNFFVRKVTPRKGFVDNDHLRGLSGVLATEVATPHEVDAHGLKIFLTDNIRVD